MNKYIKYLVERLFDNDDDDLINDTEDISLGIEDGFLNNPVNKLCDIVYNIIKNDPSYRRYILEYCIDNCIHAEVLSQTLCFYYITDNNKKKYIPALGFPDIATALKFINIAKTSVIENILMQINLEIRGYNKFTPEELNNNILDFKNIRFFGCMLKGITIKNFILDYDYIISHTENIGSVLNSGSEYDKINNFTRGLFNKCDINDVYINSCHDIQIICCYNMQDFSFIKKVTRELEFQPFSIRTFPATHNFTGLPNGDYSLRVTYEPGNEKSYATDKPLNFIGLPKCKSYRIRAEVKPEWFLPYMSFEGLTMELLPKFEFEAGHFPGKYTVRNILLGPYKIEAKCRNWHPTMPLYKTIIQTLDWFLDCWSDKPHKEYVAPNTDLTNKALLQQQDKLQEIQDRKDDFLEEIKNVKKYLKPETTYKGPDTRFSILVKEITDERIHYYKYNKYRPLETFNKYQTYQEFFKWLTDYAQGILLDADNPKSKSLYDLIITSVVRKREKINKQRKLEKKQAKEQERLLKQLEKELLKQLEKQDKKEQSKPKPVIKKPVVPLKTVNVHIYDYSDKAIAIYGDYNDMKPIIQKLKDLGCKYNKFLTINGLKTPGWIVGKRKRQEVEEIINSL